MPETRPETFRADVSMRLVLDESSYAAVGRLMDAIKASVTDAIAAADVGPARFDFTGFNTHPCKASRMEQLAMTPLVHDGEPF